MVSGQRLAYWGHGANFQASRPDSMLERMKRLMMRQVDWWFAYTSLSQAAVRAAGFPEARITVVQNAIDGAALEAGLRSVTPDRIATERRRLGIVGARVGLYCGGMYPDKRLDFVIEACLRLRERLPDFEMVFVGAGPDEPLVRQACARHPWMHYVGAVFGAERALYFAMAQVLLMPGAVGLAIIDSFSASTPLFTTRMPTHGPEIAYLAPGINGVITEPEVDDYARAVGTYLSDPAALARLREGCRAAAAVYTLDAMTRNFAAGVQACLAAERR
jgi:glycosyltransferase involved in cell wall biosynthesis